MANACSFIVTFFVSLPVLSLMALDSFLVCRSSPNFSSTVFLSFLFRDLDRPDHAGRLRPRQVDREQSVLQVGFLHLHAVRQHESSLELAGGDAAMQVLPALVVLLASPDDELFLLDGHLELIERETRDRQRDAQAFGVVAVGSEPFDVVRGVPVSCLGYAVERTLDLVEADQKRTGQRRNTRHPQSPRFQATLTGAP